MVQARKNAPSPKRRRPAAPAGKSWLLWLAGILVATFVVYLPVLDNQFTDWDDTHFVTQNPLLWNPDVHAILTTPIIGSYHPLTVASLVLNYKISGLNPASYFWLNLLLHLANTALTFLFIRKLTDGGLWAPIVCGFFFGVHPMHVESVAWIAERKDVLYALFYLAGLLTYLRYLEARRPVWLFSTFAAFVLSVASKPAAIVFPLTLVAVDWYRRRPWSGGSLLEKTPFLAISIAAGVLAIQAQKGAGALQYLGVYGPFDRVLVSSYGTVMYLVKLVAPFHLSAIYPTPTLPLERLGPEFYLCFAALAVLLPLAVYLFRRNRAVLFGFAFFFINIVLVLQIVNFAAALLADRFTYIPYIGLFFALSYWLDERVAVPASETLARSLVKAFLVLLVPVCLFQTRTRVDVWQNSETLWNDTIQKYPHRIVDAYNLRGYYYHYTAGKLDAAMADYNEALRLNPTSPHVWNNKGALWSQMGREDSALACFDRAIASKPPLADPLNNRGAVKGRLGDLAGAIADFSRAIEIDPRFRGPYENRAVAYYMTREYGRAVADSRRALALDPANPDNPAIHDAIGTYLQAMGRPGEAVPEHTLAIQSAPYGDPRIGGFYMNRSLAWSALGDLGRALGDAQEAQRRGVPAASDLLKKLGG